MPIQGIVFSLYSVMHTLLGIVNKLWFGEDIAGVGAYI